MHAFLQVISLEMKSLVRSRTLATLLGLVVIWMLGLPFILRADGTAEGARELYVRFSLGGAFLLTLVVLLASATGSLAHERTSRRLQLTLVRPVYYLSIIVGKIIAHVVIGAIVLAVACGILAVKVDLSRPCNHVLSPILPSVREEALAMYETYMKDPQTSDEVRKAKREVVLRLLENRAIDHYQTVPTNATSAWRFSTDVNQLDPRASSVRVRMRFAARFDTRQDVRGQFRMGVWQTPVSNITQAVVSIPLVATADATDDGASLRFRNEGRESLMLRPRKDLSVLVSADGFGWNLLRSYVALLALLTLVVSCGLFLSAGLGRPVALFVAFSTLIVGEMAPSVIESYPDELETNAADRIGLVITRATREVTRPISSASPLSALAEDECVETEEVLRSVLMDVIVWPLLLALLASFILPRKQGDSE